MLTFILKLRQLIYPAGRTDPTFRPKLFDFQNDVLRPDWSASPAECCDWTAAEGGGEFAAAWFIEQQVSQTFINLRPSAAAGEGRAADLSDSVIRLLFSSFFNVSAWRLVWNNTRGSDLQNNRINLPWCGFIF